jgi:ubiquinone/menaquinone biosynthesis C-methylase UbiE
VKQSKWAREYYTGWNDYDAYLASLGWRVPAQLAQAVAPHLPGHFNVLDVGCGTGQVGEQLRKHGFTGRILGFDAAEKRLADARARALAGRRVYDLTRAGDAYRLPWTDGSFDAVVSCALLGLVGSRALVRMVRVLRTGGVLGITVVRSTHRKEFTARYGKVIGALDGFIGSRLLEVLERRELDDPYDGGRDDERYDLFVCRLTRPYRERR